MHIELLKNEGDWDALAPKWNTLLDESHNNSPFLRYEFQRAWWAHKGGGEWPAAELFLLVGYGEDQTLKGIAPLFRVHNEGVQELRFIGSHEIADFLDVICRAQDLPDFLDSLMRFLANELAEEWDTLDLCNLLDSSGTVRWLDDASETRSFTVSKETLQASPYISVPESFEAYLEALDGKDAHELRRKMRRAGRYPVPIELEILTGEDDYEAGLNSFFELMAKEPEKAAFLQGSMLAQMQAIGRAAFEGGWGQLAFLRIGHRRAAAYLNFDCDNRIWAYNAGFDPDFSELSPGWLLMAEMMAWCVENGRAVFDFMRGDEAYKYRFGGQNRFVVRTLIARNASDSNVSGE